MAAPFNFALSANGDIDLSICGVIGDGWADEPCTVDHVRGALKESPKAKVIRAYVDSPGGSFFEGLGMYQLLHEHPARVEVTIGARAASAASLLAMAGDDIAMHETSAMLIHPVWTSAYGNASDFRKLADDLDRLSDCAVLAYAARSGLKAEDVVVLLNEDRYMNAAEALKLGFCTRVRKAKTKDDGDNALVNVVTEQELRNEVSKLRARSNMRASTFSFAAMTPTNRPAAKPEARTAEKELDMNFALIAAALGIVATANEQDAVNSIQTIKAKADSNDYLLKELGVENLEQAKGKLKALQESAARATVLEADNKKLADEAKTKMIADALDPESSSEHAGKLTPSLKSWAEGQSLEALQSYLANASRQLPSARANTKTEGGSKSYVGKRWEDMTAQELRDLNEKDPAAYNAALDDYNNRGGR